MLELLTSWIAVVGGILVAVGLIIRQVRQFFEQASRDAEGERHVEWGIHLRFYRQLDDGDDE